MSVVIETAPLTTAGERAARLNAAGAAWTTRVSAAVADARLTCRVSGAGERSVASRITAGKHVFLVDEPAGLAGDDSAASPVEIALGGLIACQVVVYRLYAHTLGITVDTLSIDAEGDIDVQGLFGIDDSVRPGFSAIRLNVTVAGPETAERYEELQLAVDAHCPVLDLFTHATPVTVTLVANQR